MQVLGVPIVQGLYITSYVVERSNAREYRDYYPILVLVAP
jgi:hypothetical protein